MGRQSLNSKFLCRMYPHLMIPSSNYWTNRTHIDWEITPSLFDFLIFRFPAHSIFRGWWDRDAPRGGNSVTTHWKCQKVGGYISFLVSVWRLDFLIVVFSSAVYFAHSEKKSVLVHCWGLIDELQNYTSQKHVLDIYAPYCCRRLPASNHTSNHASNHAVNEKKRWENS